MQATETLVFGQFCSTIFKKVELLKKCVFESRHTQLFSTLKLTFSISNIVFKLPIVHHTCWWWGTGQWVSGPVVGDASAPHELAR